MNLILASKSPRRKELLESEGFTFNIITKEVDEIINPNLTPYENVKNISYLKGYEVSKENKDSLVLSCDTIVCLDGKIYGKPKDRIDAYNTLKTFSGKTHEVVSGVAIMSESINVSMYVKSNVTFKTLTDEDINSYLDTQEPYDKAGSYAIQGIGKKLIESYSGSLNNIIGLPIEYIKDLIKVVLYEVED